MALRPYNQYNEIMQKKGIGEIGKFLGEYCRFSWQILSTLHQNLHIDLVLDINQMSHELQFFSPTFCQTIVVKPDGRLEQFQHRHVQN